MKAQRRIAVIGALAITIGVGTLGAVLATGGVAGARTTHAARTAAATTADYDLAVSVQAGTTTYSGSIDGQFDFATAQIAGTISIPEGFGTIISAISPKLASLVPAAVDADTSAQIVYSGGTLYANLAGLPIGSKQWVGIHLGASKGSASTFKTVAKGFENVKKLNRLARRLGATITPLGTKTIGNATAKGYSASIGMSSALKLVPGISATTKSAISGAVGATVPVQVWTEGGHVVQVTIDVTLPSTSSIQSVDISLNLTNWGGPVTIAAPPASEVLTLPFSL